MSGDLSVQPNAPVAAPVRVQPPAQASGAALANDQHTTLASASPDLPNPRLTVAPGLNRVVLEFFDSSGALTNTIPSQKQLDAYRLAALSGVPNGNSANG
jgi:hypothetical protein